MTPKTALKTACAKMGTAKALAGAIRVAPSTITYWLLKGRVPADFVAKVEYVSGISRHDLRPDIYPRDK